MGITSYFNDTYPLFVKPANAGSSVGISKVKNAEELPKALETAFAEDDKVLVEEAITGREIEVAVLGNEEPEASCIGEIFAANEFYDYNAKYENDASKTAVVTDLDPKKEQEIKDTAVKIYRIMGCRGLAQCRLFLKRQRQSSVQRNQHAAGLYQYQHVLRSFGKPPASRTLI